MNIAHKDITFVVQGTIIGRFDDEIKDRYTFLCLKSIREYFPSSFIILSTWKGSDVRGLDFDLLVESNDPGVSILGDFSKNGFRQIVSSLEGIKGAYTKYSVKVRSDLIFKSSNFLKYFEKYSQFPYNYDYKLVEKRVVMLTTCNPKRRFKFPYNAADWFYFGLTKDLLDIFNVDLVSGDYVCRHEYDNQKKKCISPYSSEQYIWFNFLSKYKKINFKNLRDISNNNIEESEKYFANNTILLTAKMAGLDWLKYPGAAYAQIPCLSNTGLYTFTEYREMLKKYTPSKLFIFPNIMERFVYFMVYNLRFLIKSRNKKIYKIISYILNRENHERLKKNNIETY
ncbi:MAG: WavE lipopolysaccharide synthesis family protein [Candidatus Paceibacterota bacterium]|jgi:hypothetical protein